MLLLKNKIIMKNAKMHAAFILTHKRVHYNIRKKL